MKIVFMGTPVFATNILQSLIDNYEVVGVVSQPDKEVGRKKILTNTPIKELALNNNIEVFQPVKIRNDYQKIVEWNGQIIPKEVLDIPRLGCINVHASLLPKYRGGAPIHRAIINGDSETGITIMYMDVGMDTGDMISKRSIPIEIDDNLETLSNKLSKLGSELLIEVLPSIIDGTNGREKQNEDEVSFAYNIKPEDEVIDFNKSTLEIYNLIRGLSPSIGAYFMMDDNRTKVYKSRIGTNKYDKPGVIFQLYKDGIGISTGDGEIILEEIQPFGKKKMDVSSYLNGIDKNKLINKVL